MLKMLIIRTDDFQMHIAWKSEFQNVKVLENGPTWTVLKVNPEQFESITSSLGMTVIE